MSHPDAPALIAAVQLFLREAETALHGRLAFHAKVAGNVLGIVLRELEQAPDAAETGALAPWGGPGGLCAALRDGQADPQDPVLLAALREAVLARLAVDNPRYSTFARLRERPIA